MKLSASDSIIGGLCINGESVSYLDIVTMRGLESLVSCLGSPFSFKRSWMPFIAVGQGELGISTEDKVLENEQFRKLSAISTYRNSYIVQTVFGVDEPSVEYILREVGIFNQLAGGIMGARWVLDNDYIIQASDEVNITCTIYVAQ